MLVAEVLGTTLEGGYYAGLFLLGVAMSARGKRILRIECFIRNLHGGSQPILVQASDGLHYVVKFTENPQGPDVLFNECVGTALYRGCKLATPAWMPLAVTQSFIDRNQSCWTKNEGGMPKPSAGLCFGSRFLGWKGARIFEILPPYDFKRVRKASDFWLAWLIDVCAGHVDNRQAIFVEDARGAFNPFFIDHGYLFGDPKRERMLELKALCCASRHVDPRIYPGVSSQQLRGFLRVVANLDADRLWQQIQSVPTDWTSASTLEGFSKCLDKLSSANLVKNILEAIKEEQTQDNERTKRRMEQLYPEGLLGLRVPAVEPEPREFPSCAGHTHRA
jgi:hypothetical protein